MNGSDIYCLNIGGVLLPVKVTIVTSPAYLTVCCAPRRHWLLEIADTALRLIANAAINGDDSHPNQGTTRRWQEGCAGV
ncbi:MAG: hypothetical protein EPN76_12910 [Burkholderiaceae bacterium]|nr:MAG: hypothetical protein EPN76_12910 [Burkholderiaceae bacterium]